MNSTRDVLLTKLAIDIDIVLSMKITSLEACLLRVSKTPSAIYLEIKRRAVEMFLKLGQVGGWNGEGGRRGRRERIEVFTP